MHELADGRRAREAHWAEERHEGSHGGHVGYRMRHVIWWLYGEVKGLRLELVISKVPLSLSLRCPLA